MTRKIKWTVKEVREDVDELNMMDVLYTKRIISFIRRTTKEEILDDLKALHLLTEDIRRTIEGH